MSPRAEIAVAGGPTKLMLLLKSLSAITLKVSVILHGIVAALFFLSNITTIAIATALQSYLVDNSKRLRKLSGHQEEAIKLVGKELKLKRRVLFSLIVFGVLAVVSNLILFTSNVATQEQLSEISGPVLQYVTVVHIFFAHISFVHDVRIYMM